MTPNTPTFRVIDGGMDSKDDGADSADGQAGMSASTPTHVCLPQQDLELFRSGIRECEEVLERLPQMDDFQAYTALKIFDGDYLKVRKTPDGMVVDAPDFAKHHLKPLKIRLKDICENRREQLSRILRKKEAGQK